MFAILLFIWKEINASVFSGSLMPVEDVASLVFEHVEKWASPKSDVRILRVHLCNENTAR